MSQNYKTDNNHTGCQKYCTIIGYFLIPVLCIVAIIQNCIFISENNMNPCQHIGVVALYLSIIVIVGNITKFAVKNNFEGN
jgi:hypothetical protein